MALFDKYKIQVDASAEKVKEVMENCVDTKFRLVNTQNNSKPFTGKVESDNFWVKINNDRPQIIVYGKVNYLSPGKSEIEFKTHLLGTRILGGGFILFMILSFMGMMIFAGIEEIGLLIFPILFVGMLILASLFFVFFGTPKSEYKNVVYTIMRRIDRHEDIL